MNTLTADEYQERLSTDTDHLVDAAAHHAAEYDAYEDPVDAVLDAVVDALDAHDWFAYGPGGEGAAFHGSIIDHVREANVNVEMYNDWESLMEGDTPTESVQMLSYCAYQAHVTREARRRLRDE